VTPNEEDEVKSTLDELRGAEKRVSESIRHRESELRQIERQILEKIRRGERVSRNVDEVHREQMTLGERMADNLAQLAGSWRFIGGFFGVILVWIAVNSVLLIVRPWDPYPFILLNLFLSLLAGIQAPVIMMSQNRQEGRDRLRAQQDFEVNLKAELEIEQLHDKLDQLREQQWRELLELQERQLRLLEEQVALLRQSSNAAVKTTSPNEGAPPAN
jgi:uncharacterized membrane protein